MSRDGKKTGGRNFKKGTAANPGGFTKEQAKAKHLTRETLKDLMNVLNSATHEDMQMFLEKPATTALTMMIVKGYMNAIETGDWKQIELVLQRLVGKVADVQEVSGKLYLERFEGGGAVLGSDRSEE